MCVIFVSPCPTYKRIAPVSKSNLNTGAKKREGVFHAGFVLTPPKIAPFDLNNKSDYIFFIFPNEPTF